MNMRKERLFYIMSDDHDKNNVDMTITAQMIRKKTMIPNTSRIVDEMLSKYFNTIFTFLPL